MSRGATYVQLLGALNQNEMHDVARHRGYSTDVIRPRDRSLTARLLRALRIIRG
ncbi:MAG: hypothetical protein M3P32_07680 [Chloroflexota bacterium]|nr:hypothetical protein [Chloroflexota bacterium]